MQAIKHKRIKEVRGQGLFIGIELFEAARPYCEALMAKGILAKETHENTIRFAPPLVISKADLDQAIITITEVLAN